MRPITRILGPGGRQAQAEGSKHRARLRRPYRQPAGLFFLGVADRAARRG